LGGYPSVGKEETLVKSNVHKVVAFTLMAVLLVSLPLLGACAKDITSEPAAAPAVESEAALEEVSATPGGFVGDLREWIAYLEEQGLARTVTAPVTCGGEIQEIARQMSAIGMNMKQAENAQAVLFENIEGYTNTWCTKLFVGSLNTTDKLCRAIGADPGLPPPAVIDAIIETAERDPIPPVTVDTGPVKQNIIKAAQVDLFDIPVPQWHPGDEYRYINTWHAVVTKHAETGEVNVGTYRGAIYDKNHIISLLVESQHWGQHFRSWRERGEDMPVAFVYGWNPSMILVGGSPWHHPNGLSEWAWLGAIMGEPVELVKCETVDLYVPASAEIVIEGHVLIDPETYVQEGPIKEISGGYSFPMKNPLTKVSCITHRDDPIYTGSAIGTAPVFEEQKIAFAFGGWALLKKFVMDTVPGVLDLTITPMCAVKIHKMYQGHAFQVGCALFAHKTTHLPWKMWFVVEEDVNIYDAGAVYGAVSNNCNPEEDIYIFRQYAGIVDASLGAHGLNIEEYGSALSTRCLVDATVNWIRHPRIEVWEGARVAPLELAPEADFNEVMERWEEYGFGDLPFWDQR